MTRRWRPPPEIGIAAKARRELRERAAGRPMTRDEKRLDQRYGTVLTPFEALSLQERVARYGLPDDQEADQ